MTHRTSVFVNAINTTMETLLLLYKTEENISAGVFGDLKKTYEAQRKYDGSPAAQRRVHSLIRMEDTLKKYNMYWNAAEQY